MNFIITTGFENISHEIRSNPETESKGEALVKANHVRNVEEYRRNGESFLIKARVIRQTSINETPYVTELHIQTIDPTILELGTERKERENNQICLRKVVDVSCTCVYNKSKKCKHVAALIYYINHEESLTKTDVEQVWGKPTPRQFAKEKYSKGSYFCDMWLPNDKPKKQDPGIRVSDLEQNPSALREILIASSRKKDETAIRYLMTDILEKVDTKLQKDECAECLQILFNFTEKYQKYETTGVLEKNMYNFYEDAIVLSREEIIKLCCDTLKQSECREWFAARRMRISASKSAHSVKSRKTKPIETLIKELLYPAKIDTASTCYGKKHEDDARNEYQETYNVVVQRIGLLVSEKQPWLCANLDGVVFEDSCLSKVVELKCPESCKDKPIVDLVEKKCNVKYLQFVGDKVILRESCIYYTQCQIQMYVSGLNICDLYVWSPVESQCINVYRNEKFIKQVIEKCEYFYFHDYLPKLYKTVTDEAKLTTLENGKLKTRSFTGLDLSNIF